MKYIIIEAELEPDIKITIPVIFASDLVHKKVSQAIQMVILNAFQAESKVVSAGYAKIKDIICTGESESLHIKAKNSDSLVIRAIN